MILTRDNYHSLEAERAYMSRSQYQGFQGCEAKQMATLEGKWEDEVSEALLVGSYVHSWNEGTQKKFIKENPDMFTKARELKAPFKQAEKMILALETDPLCKYMLQGKKEVVLTAEFAGAMWKVMLDVLNSERQRIVDLKTTKSIRERSWDEQRGCKVSFIEQYNYPLQAALYSEIERLATGRDAWLDFFMVAVSKEKVPDKEIIELNDGARYQYELEQVKENMPRILAVKAGIEEPKRCESCDYCRSTRKLSGVVHYMAI